MSNMDDASAVPVSSDELLEAEAGFSSATQTLERLITSDEVDDSILSAVQIVVDSFVWMRDLALGSDGMPSGSTLFTLAAMESTERRFVNAAREIQDLLLLIADGGRADYVAGLAEELLNELILTLRGVLERVPAGLIETRQAVETRLRTVLTARNQYQLWHRNQSAVVRLEEAASASEESAGGRAEQSLSAEFDLLASREGRLANAFRLLTITLFVVVIAYAAVVALEAKKPSIEVGQRLAVGVPVLLLAGYFSREASQHRRTQRWASVLGAQLRSVRAYTLSMSADASDELRLALGRRAFLESPEASQTHDEGSGASMTPESIRDLTELIRAANR